MDGSGDSVSLGAAVGSGDTVSLGSDVGSGDLLGFGDLVGSGDSVGPGSSGFSDPSFPNIRSMRAMIATSSLPWPPPGASVGSGVGRSDGPLGPVLPLGVPPVTPDADVGPVGSEGAGGPPVEPLGPVSPVGAVSPVVPPGVGPVGSSGRPDGTPETPLGSASLIRFRDSSVQALATIATRTMAITVLRVLALATMG